MKDIATQARELDAKKEPTPVEVAEGCVAFIQAGLANFANGKPQPTNWWSYIDGECTSIRAGAWRQHLDTPEEAKRLAEEAVEERRSKATNSYADWETALYHWSLGKCAQTPRGAAYDHRCSCCADADRVIDALIYDEGGNRLPPRAGGPEATPVDALRPEDFDALDDPRDGARPDPSPIEVGDYVRSVHHPWEAGQVRSIEGDNLNVITTSGWSRGSAACFVKLIEERDRRERASR